MTDLLTATLEFALRGHGVPAEDWPDRPAARVDLHCHSTFSDERLPFLPGLLWHPLATPVQVYDLAKARGMDFVTITDHDTIEGCLDLLDRRGPLADFVVGEEVSVRFPEDGTLIHINVYGHNEAQHREIQRLRDNIYDVVDYVQRIDRPYVLNHMTWTAQQRVLSVWQIEALLDRFRLFEGLNGTRSYMHNAFVWQATRECGKVLVAGSDSHTYRVGTTFTRSQGASVAELFASLRAGRAVPCGSFGTPEKLREDVWLTLQKTVETRLAETSRAWERFLYRLVRRVGKTLHPLACLGYHKHQDTLIRHFLQALPA